jgi:hypothetical protein
MIPIPLSSFRTGRQEAVKVMSVDLRGWLLMSNALGNCQAGRNNISQDKFCWQEKEQLFNG